MNKSDDISYLRESDYELLADLSRWLAVSDGVLASPSPPAMPTRDARGTRLWEAMSLWIKTARTWNPQYRDRWYPHGADFKKSRLFWRIRSGRQPLPEPPPCAFSCPWYEVVEEDQPHWCSDVSPSSMWEDAQYSPRLGPTVQINQCSYQLLHKVTETEAIVQYGSYRYWLWKGEKDRTGTLTLERPEGGTAEMTISVKRWFLQRVVEAPQGSAWFPWS